MPGPRSVSRRPRRKPRPRDPGRTAATDPDAEAEIFRPRPCKVCPASSAEKNLLEVVAVSQLRSAEPPQPEPGHRKRNLRQRDAKPKQPHVDRIVGGVVVVVGRQRSVV